MARFVLTHFLTFAYAYLSTPLEASRKPFDGQPCGLEPGCVYHTEYYNKYSFGLFCIHPDDGSRCPTADDLDQKPGE
jgi:hypothetical protein